MNEICCPQQLREKKMIKCPLISSRFLWENQNGRQKPKMGETMLKHLCVWSFKSVCMSKWLCVFPQHKQVCEIPHMSKQPVDFKRRGFAPYKLTSSWGMRERLYTDSTEPGLYCMYIDGNTDLYATCTTHAALGISSPNTWNVAYIYYLYIINIWIGKEWLFGLNLLKILFLSELVFCFILKIEHCGFIVFFKTLSVAEVELTHKCLNLRLDPKVSRSP